MPKAKTIDRIALTKSHSKYLQEVEKMKREGVKDDIQGDICPVCGATGLIHESGCVKCLKCGWSKCG